MDPNKLPDLEVLAPYNKTVFGVPRVTNVFPIGAADVQEDDAGQKVIQHFVKADVTGKENAELLCLGVDALKFLHELAEDAAISRYIGTKSIDKNVKLHRIMHRLAEI